MKLWMKISLVSMLIVVLAVSVTALFVSQSYFSLMIRQEKENALARHEYITTGIANKMTFERLRSSELSLSKDRVGELIKELASEQSGSGDTVAVYTESGELTSSMDELKEASAGLVAKVRESGSAYSTVAETYDEVYLIVGSAMSIEGARYYPVTAHDVTSIYQNHETALSFIRNMSVILAFASSVILLILVYSLLRPLSSINRSIRRIAGGNYSARAPERGGAEFAELGRSVNLMAGSIEENVAELQEIAESRKRFTDNLAHEMKTPLTSIICLADVLRIKKRISDRERTECADIIVEEAKRLKSLSGKLLELTVAGNAELDFRPVDIGEVLSSVETAFKPIFERCGMFLNIQPVSVVINMDRELFTSLLYNLIDNARKASSPGGTVDVAAEVKGNELIISVVDSGVGMSRSELKRITEPFYMVDKSRSRKAGGAGLGLSLCMEIAKQHNASLVIDSFPKIGTTVTVTVPVGGKAHE